MKTITYSGQFKKDVALAQRRGKDMSKLKQVIELLARGQALPIRLKDHALKSNWKGCRDLHIEPDWILIYSMSSTSINFERTGTHSDIF